MLILGTFWPKMKKMIIYSERKLKVWFIKGANQAGTPVKQMWYSLGTQDRWGYNLIEALIISITLNYKLIDSPPPLFLYFFVGLPFKTTTNYDMNTISHVSKFVSNFLMFMSFAWT